MAGRRTRLARGIKDRIGVFSLPLNAVVWKSDENHSVLPRPRSSRGRTMPYRASGRVSCSVRMCGPPLQRVCGSVRVDHRGEPRQPGEAARAAGLLNELLTGTPRMARETAMPRFTTPMLCLPIMSSVQVMLRCNIRG